MPGAAHLGRALRRGAVLLAPYALAVPLTSAAVSSTLEAQRAGAAPPASTLRPAAGRAPGLPRPVARAIDRLFAPFAGDTTPGYAVAVLRDGRPVHWRGHGMANLDESAPITPATVFNVASLSKQFTAACLALTILDGKVRLEDTAATYVPALAKYHAGGRPPILVKHLVYMTSGLPDYYTVPRKNGRTWSPTTSSP